MERLTAGLFRPLPQAEVRLGGQKLTLGVPTAAQVLEAKAEAAQLCHGEPEEALISNACLLARALQAEGSTLFEDGQQVLAALSPREIGRLAQTLDTLCQASDPGVDTPALDTEGYLDALRADPSARLRWRVQKAFHALPTEERVKQMHQRDYLTCLLHMMLDEEERLAQLCPSCRQKAEQKRCTCCGAALDEGTGVNSAFDQAQFDKLCQEGTV